MAPGWSWVSNFSMRNKGRIWIIWYPKFTDFKMIDMDAQCIHGQIRIYEMNIVFQFTVVYGLHTVVERRRSWATLKEIQNLQHGP